MPGPGGQAFPDIVLDCVDECDECSGTIEVAR